MNGRVRRCLANSGVEQRGLCGDVVVERDIEDEEVDDDDVGCAK